MAFLGPPTEISDVAHWQNFSVGPDGSLLVANLGQSVSTEEIYLVSLADSSIQHIPTNFSGSAQPLLPSFSPNGERIVLEYDQQNGGSKFIASVDLEREFATRLTSGGDYEDPDWSFDGSSVYYSDPSGKIYRRSADGSGAQEDISVNGMQVTTSPRGNTLSYIQRGFDRTHEVLLAYDLDAAEESVIDSTNSLKSRPTFSPDGQYIAFTHFPEAGIGARSIIDGVYQPLTELVGVRPIWSADGEYVYFGIHNNGIYRIPVSNESRLQVNGPPTKILSLVGSVSFDVDSTGDRLIVVASNVDFTRPNDQYSSTLLWKQNWAQSLSDK